MQPSQQKLASTRSENARQKWPDWTGRTAVCIATGPSLTAEQCDHLKSQIDIRVIGVCEAGLPDCYPLSFPWCDILYAADAHWWHHYQPSHPFKVSGEPVVAQRVNGVTYDAIDTTVLKMLARDERMPREPGSVLSGDHSGFQALGLALSLGASRVVLLGYDAGGPQRNAHLDRPAKFTQSGHNYAIWRDFYRRVPGQWPDVEIINCSPLTAIDAFPVADIKEVLT